VTARGPPWRNRHFLAGVGVAVDRASMVPWGRSARPRRTPCNRAPHRPGAGRDRQTARSADWWAWSFWATTIRPWCPVETVHDARPLNAGDAGQLVPQCAISALNQRSRGMAGRGVHDKALRLVDVMSSSSNTISSAMSSPCGSAGTAPESIMMYRLAT